MNGVIVLAAGESSRMGRAKQLLPYRGSNLLRHAAETALATGLGPVLIVLGAEAGRCRDALGLLDIRTVINPDWPLGMGSSIATGLAEITRLVPRLEGVLILLHDQPAIAARRLRELVETRGEEDLIVAAHYGDVVGVPAYFRREIFEELSRLGGAAGARKILELHRTRTRHFDMPEARFDIDTPADYEWICGQEKQQREHMA
jgi:molybdenum cofactor cytidylyltransferase